MALVEAPNLRHLRMVQVIGQSGGVCQAARAVRASQPSVTQALSNIEGELGARVFARCATGSYPTALGARYLLRLDRFFEILDNAMNAVLSPGAAPDTTAHKVDRLLTSTQVRSLIVTCETGQVETIADRVGVSAPSLFRSARTIERVLGRELFDRTAHGLIPNKTGTFLAREFRKALREIEMAKGEVLLASGSQSLEVVVGTLPMAGSHELAIAARTFMTAYPAANLRLVSGDYHKLLDDLSNSRIDMIFGILRTPDWATDVEEELLARDHYYIVARPGHPLAGIPDVGPRQLAQCDWVVPPSGTPRRSRIERLFDDASGKPRFNCETSSLSNCRALLLNSDAVTMMARAEIEHEVQAGLLTSLDCRFLEYVLRRGLTTRRDWLPTEAHLAFVADLRDAIEQSARNSTADRIKLVS